MLTMFVSGLWHGTTLSFVLFGLVHGLYLVVFRAFEHLMTKSLGRASLRKLRANPIWIIASIFVTFNVTAAAYTFFVLDTHQLLRILERFIS